MMLSIAVAVAMLAGDAPMDHPVKIASYGGVPIDLELGRERAEGGNWAVSDCSTADTQCVAGYYYRLAMPRNCATIQVGDTFRAGPVQTDVLWKAPRSPALLPFFNGPITIVGSADRRWIVYVYSGSTLSAIYVDTGHNLDVYSAAQQSGLSGIKALETVPNRMFLPLQTFRGIIECPTYRP